MVDKRSDVNPKEGEKEYGDVKYADEKNKKYPIDTAEHIRAAWDYIHQAKNAGKYSSEDVKTIKSKIASAWKDKIDKGGPPEAKMAKDPELKNTLLHGVEIFEAGKWPGSGVNGYRFTKQDIDDIASSFSALGLSGRVPIKLGHDDTDYMSDDGAPALGWVEKVWADGDKLMADINVVSPKLASLIEARAYKFVSVELLKDVQADTRKIPWVLDAVALLGASQPAVGVLKDLQASLRMARGSGLRSGTRCAFRREFSRTGDDNEMTPEEVQASIDKALEPMKAQIKASEARAIAAEAEAAKVKLSAHRASIVAVFEQAISAGTVLPAAREKFSKANGVESDERVMTVTVKDAQEFIEQVKDLPQYKGPKQGGSGAKFTVGASDEIETEGKTSSDVVSALVDAEMRSDKIASNDNVGRKQCFARVLKNNPDLARQYWDDPGEVYAPAAA